MSVLGVMNNTTDIVGGISGGVSHRITASISELESAIASLDKASNDYLNLVRRLDSVINSMAPLWTGAAGEQYIANLKYKRRMLMNLVIILGNIQQLAIRRKNKLEERRIWSTEISNAADKVGDVLSVIDSIL